ncbi:hypothetical protein EYF80_054418 [Liparis tanakae]|uniref:Uncharacterized protein n=1 Tax=Liparis tanakae TaxID=230148 RepID=A0A4Z2F2R7_9TELE|nr:hypothetical protein EYF80_054418 [Liparis tanakae]
MTSSSASDLLPAAGGSLEQLEHYGIDGSKLLPLASPDGLHIRHSPAQRPHRHLHLTATQRRRDIGLLMSQRSRGAGPVNTSTCLTWAKSAASLILPPSPRGRSRLVWRTNSSMALWASASVLW